MRYFVTALALCLLSIWPLPADSAPDTSPNTIQFSLDPGASVTDLDTGQLVAKAEGKYSLLTWQADVHASHRYRISDPGYDDHEVTLFYTEPLGWNFRDAWTGGEGKIVNVKNPIEPLTYPIQIGANVSNWGVYEDDPTGQPYDVAGQQRKIKELPTTKDTSPGALENGKIIHLPKGQNSAQPIYINEHGLAPGQDAEYDWVAVPGVHFNWKTDKPVHLVSRNRHLALYATCFGLVVVVLGGLGWRQKQAIRRRLEQTESQALIDYDRDGATLLPLARQVGSYKVVGKLGAGGMAAVYAVVDQQGLRYALKLPSPDSLQDPGTRERFLRECKLCMRLVHPNIVRTFDGGTYESAQGLDVPYMVMELVEGTTLDSVMRGRAADSPKPSITFAVQIMQGILEGLTLAHRLKVVHRDIKPSNVMVTTAGQVKLMDFGIAHMATHKTLTATGMVIGTPAYMAPEQATNGKEIDDRADIYAAGVMLFELLTYRLPFDDHQGDPWQVVVKKLSADAPSVHSLNPDVPPTLDDIVARMLRSNRDERYARVSEVLEKLRNLTG